MIILTYIWNKRESNWVGGLRTQVQLDMGRLLLHTQGINIPLTRRRASNSIIRYGVIGLEYGPSSLIMTTG